MQDVLGFRGEVLVHVLFQVVEQVSVVGDVFGVQDVGLRGLAVQVQAVVRLAGLLLEVVAAEPGSHRPTS